MINSFGSKEIEEKLSVKREKLEVFQSNNFVRDSNVNLMKKLR